jgi:mRNA-degrading endonuclease RelE of RelBE toxin-antitoxin system
MDVRMMAEAIADYRRLPLVIRLRVAAILEKLEQWPQISGAKPLGGNLQGHFRLRTGDWRIVVKPVGQVLWIVRIDNRRDVYGD